MLRVLLMQLPVPNNAVTNVPLAAGYLKAYAQAQGLLERVQIEILPRSIADAAGDAMLVEAIARHAPDVLGISLYTWNSERSLDVARRAKQALPNMLVVVGGPEVQRDNAWVLEHRGADVFVFGEGEQTFVELMRVLDESPRTKDKSGSAFLSSLGLRLSSLPGIGFRDATSTLITTPERVALENLAVVPSPYLLGYLEADPGGMLMVEISRWCPYACSFCLYGRNMGAKLGSRYFPLERVLAEIAWGKARGVAQVHFIEANLNLVPLFQPLMAALEDMNADGQLALYAELRGEHLREEIVTALAKAGMKVAEVGLQTANPEALRAAHRRTDLGKWAAGTRRLYEHGIEVLLDVIIGLPEDDAEGVAQTLAFIGEEQLGAYDAFTLQVLPGTAVRSGAGEHGLIFQERPPYYVLGTSRLSYAELRRLRREVKHGAGIEPDAVEGCPEPRLGALANLQHVQAVPEAHAINRVLVGCDCDRPDITRLSVHVDCIGLWSDMCGRWADWLAQAITCNPSTLFDIYVTTDMPPERQELEAWRAQLPFQPGYLDRVAMYRHAQPDVAYDRVSPRLWLVVPWTAQVEPAAYTGIAEVVWSYKLAMGEEPPFGAWRAAGGAGVWARGALADDLGRAAEEYGIRVWTETA